MPQQRLSMRKIRDVLKLRHGASLSLEEIARALKLSKGVVAKYLRLAQESGLNWPLPPELDDADLERRLYPRQIRHGATYAEPDCARIHQELKRKGVTLQLLWQEYRQSAGDRSYQYTAFCKHYRSFAGQLKRSMRQVHQAGEKLFADYAGPMVPIIDAVTGEVSSASIFVGVLGASSYTFACATAGQTQADWLFGIEQCLRFIGGVPALIVPDNPKALVTKADRYEPELSKGSEEFALHYGTVILPARPGKPQDKAKVEVGVQVVERWILARLRHRQFFSLVELNAAIAELLPELNERNFKKLPGNRRSVFETLDAPYLKPLNPRRYELAQWHKATVNIDYHVEFDGSYYSVPHALVGQKVDVRATRHTVEVIARSKRVTSHTRSHQVGHYATQTAHMPAAHRRHAEWTPGRFVQWAQSVGPQAEILVARLLQKHKHPEQSYRACLGLMRLARSVGKARMEAACCRAVHLGAYSYRSVASILSSGLDGQPLATQRIDLKLPEHGNVRGPAYYH